jgi:hypothetical protein
MEDWIPHAISRAVRSVAFEAIRNLGRKELALLSLIPDTEIKTSELFREYTNKFPQYKIAKATFFSMLTYLQALGLVMLMRGRGRGGSTCQLVIEPSVVREAIKAKGGI